jgi:hypothetical protein
LLRWWFGNAPGRQRTAEFHLGQREAILHTILAYELFATDQTEALFRAACEAWPGASIPRAATVWDRGSAHYRLRMVPGSGQRWVLLALLVWLWRSLRENAQTCGGLGRESGGRRLGRGLPMQVAANEAFDTCLQVFVPHRDAAQGLRLALFGGPAGMSADAGADTLRQSRVLRHADLFLPPQLRAAFGHWLAANAAATAADAPNAHHEASAASRRASDPTAWPLLRIETPQNQADIRTEVWFSLRVGANAAKPRVQVEFDCGQAAPPAHVATLCDLPLPRALEIGAVKSLALVGLRRGDSTPTHRPRARRGLRPVLPRRQRPCLDAGLRLLDRIECQTADLRRHADVAAPALLVLCEDPGLRRAVAAYARRRGAAATVCAAGNACAQRQAQVVIDTLPPRDAAMQSRFCAVVMLRAGHGMGTAAGGAHGLAAFLWPALAPHWPAPAFAATKAEQRERIGGGRPPQTLIDVVPVIAERWPEPMPVRARTPSPWLHCGIDALPTAAGGLFFAQRRTDAEAFDIVLPNPSPAAHDAPLRWWSQLPPPLLQPARCVPVRKCALRHQGWTARDDGLTRGLIEMADADPHIAAFCLFDSAQRRWPAEDDTASEGTSDRDAATGAPPVCPHALVRTPGYVYAVRFVPYLPVPGMSVPSRPAASMPATGASTHGDADALAPSGRAQDGDDALLAWCRRVNALPADRRQFREWRPVQVQAPLFWSWKRRGGSLSSLLSALAETTPITARRPRISAPSAAQPPDR